MSTVPAYIQDGNFTIAQQNGSNAYSLPFYDVGDGKSFEVRQRWRVAAVSFRSPPMMQRVNFQGFGNAYLVGCSDPEPVDNGLVEYELTYASVPMTRTTGTSIVYPMQFYSASGLYDWTQPPTITISEVQYSTAAEVDWEYSIGRPQPLLAPRIEVIFGALFNFNNWGNFKLGQRVLAQDAVIDIYKGGLYYRRSVWIRWPLNLTFTGPPA